jgi:PhnB protein
MVVNTYLYFNGQCEAAFEFYAQVLSGKITAKFTYADMPDGQDHGEFKDKIMHARLQFGDNVLLGGDAPPQRYTKPQGFSVSLGIKDPAEADRLFHALSENGVVTMPIAETFWALRFAMFTDQFGTPWMINCEKPM